MRLTQSLENLYSYRRLKSLEGMKLQQMKIEKFLEEDRKHLNSAIALTNLEQFMSGDLEMPEIYGELYIRNSTPQINY
jgi:hypothetical protein